MRRYGVLFSDNIINNLRNRRYENNYVKKTYIKKIEEMNKYKRSLAKFKKIYRLHDDYEPDNLNDKKIKDIVSTFKQRTKTTNKSLRLGTTVKVDVNRLVQQTTVNNNGPMNINIYNNLNEEQPIYIQDKISNRFISNDHSEEEHSLNDSFTNPHKKKLLTIVSKLHTKSPRQKSADNDLFSARSEGLNPNMRATMSDVKEYENYDDVVQIKDEKKVPLSKFVGPPLNITDFENEYD
jgi:hypothetical protein